MARGSSKKLAWASLKLAAPGPVPAALVRMRQRRDAGEVDTGTKDGRALNAQLKELERDYLGTVWGSGPADLSKWAAFVVFFSGGKDSLACLLHLLDAGVPKGRIVLAHHEIDEPGHDFFDWPCTPPYCRAVAKALGVNIRFSRRIGGFRGEMLREDERSQRMVFERIDRRLDYSRQAGTPNTRMKFPMPSGDLMARWCSGKLKIDVGRSWLNNDPWFEDQRVLCITGERALESKNRSLYLPFEPQEGAAVLEKGAEREATQIREDRPWWRWRPVLTWDEARVWDAIKRHRVNPHVGYKLGWGRLSCMTCIFGDKDQWASVRALDPQRFENVANMEELFGEFWRARGVNNFRGTIDPTMNVREKADRGVAHFDARSAEFKRLRDVALSSGPYAEPIIVDRWVLPPGAYKQSSGPT